MELHLKACELYASELKRTNATHPALPLLLGTTALYSNFDMGSGQCDLGILLGDDGVFHRLITEMKNEMAASTACPHLQASCYYAKAVLAGANCNVLVLPRTKLPCFVLTPMAGPVLRVAGAVTTCAVPGKPRPSSTR